MVFILDQAIAHTLVRNGGKHAFYDWICWEYLVGLPNAPFSFEFEDVATYLQKVEKDKRNVFNSTYCMVFYAHYLGSMHRCFIF